MELIRFLGRLVRLKKKIANSLSNKDCIHKTIFPLVQFWEGLGADSSKQLFGHICSLWSLSKDSGGSEMQGGSLPSVRQPFQGDWQMCLKAGIDNEIKKKRCPFKFLYAYCWPSHFPSVVELSEILTGMTVRINHFRLPVQITCIKCLTDLLTST